MDEDGSTDESADGLMNQELTRKQFLGAIGFSFLGVFGLLRLAEQMLNGHMEGEGDLTTSTEGLFGERLYGGDDEPHHPYNHKDSSY